MKTVDVMDFYTKKVTKVQKNRLAKGMFPFMFEGSCQVYWFDVRQFKRQEIFKHLQLKGTMKQKIQFIKQVLKDFKRLSYFAYDMELAGDANPEDDITFWWRVIRVIEVFRTI